MANTLYKSKLAFIQFRFLNQVSHTDNGIHWRTDFMAHVRQKFALCLSGVFSNFTGGNNFRNINHRKHVTDNRILHLERTGFAAEPCVRMRIERLEHECIFPDSLIIKCLFKRFDNIFGHATLRQVIQRLSNDFFPVRHKIAGKLPRHVHDFTVLVKNHKDGIPCREHNSI